MTPTSELVQSFQQAVEGLYLPSEADYPIRVFQWQNQEADAPALSDLLELTGNRQDSPLDIITLQELFAPVLHRLNRDGEEEQHRAQRVQDLLHQIESTLSAIQVYRVGTVEIDVYILGQASEAEHPDWVIFSTQIVET